MTTDTETAPPPNDASLFMAAETLRKDFPHLKIVGDYIQGIISPAGKAILEQDARKRNARRLSNDEILAAYDRIGTTTGTERELGVGRKVVARLLRERDAREADAAISSLNGRLTTPAGDRFLDGLMSDLNAPVTPVPVQKPAQATIEISIRELKAKLAELEAAVAKPVTIPEVKVAAAPSEKPRIRVQAGTVYAAPRSEVVDRPVFDNTACGGSRSSPFPVATESPLGDHRPLIAPIYGAHGKLSNLIIEPVSSKLLRCGFIGDTHFHPAVRPCRRQALLIGVHYSHYKPDILIHGGDSADWHSLELHSKADTYETWIRPSIKQDQDFYSECWQLMNLPMNRAGIRPRKHHTHGNHCEWNERWENKNPNTRGMLASFRDEVIESEGWTHSPYGQVAFVGGVGVCHAFLSIMGKPYGGETPEMAISNRVVHDVVNFHTHRYNAVRRVKAGMDQHVMVLNAGACMPQRYVADYARMTAGSAITSGLLDATISDGRIIGFTFTSTKELEHKYGAEVDKLMREFGE